MVSDNSWLGLIFTIIFYHAHAIRMALIRTAVFRFILWRAFRCFILHQLEVVQNMTLLRGFQFTSSDVSKFEHIQWKFLFVCHRHFFYHLQYYCAKVLDHLKFYALYVRRRRTAVVKVLCYKSEGRWFDSRWCHWNFSLT